MAALIKAMPLRGETTLPALPTTRLGGSAAIEPRAGRNEPSPSLAPSSSAPERPAIQHQSHSDKSVKADIQASLPEPIKQETAEAMRARLLEAHRETLKALEEDARREGYSSGLAKGESAGQEKYLQAVATLRKIIDSTNAAVADTIADAEEIIGAIVFEAVCKIIGDQLLTEQGVRAVVAQVVGRAKRDEVVSIKVSSGDLERLASVDALTGSGAGRQSLKSFDFEADEGVELGGCLVQLKGGYLDGRIETQFSALAQSIKEAADRRQ